MKRAIFVFLLTLLGGFTTVQVAFAQGSFTVVPSVFDPHGTHLIAAEWEGGIGCPTMAHPYHYPTGPYYLFTDPACMIGDPSGDARVEGLLLVKTGPTDSDSAATAVLVGLSGTPLHELGYDLRKPGDSSGMNVPGALADLRGSICDADSPRFNIVTAEDPTAFYFLVCNSPSPDFDFSGAGWQRLRWGSTDGSVPLMAYRNGAVLTNITNTHVKSISILLDLGQDFLGGQPYQFGLAVLDNIDVNGTLVGHGPEENENKDEDKAQGDDGKGDSVQSEDSASRPESSSMSYEDQSQGMKVQSVSGARSITYNGTCVSYAGDAVLNGAPGYLFTFEACDLSALGAGIGTFSMTVTGPLGFLYQKAAPMTSGSVSIHPH